MKNKGFSMVELIIVITIMAILAGVLTPMLIKYINKSRLSADITTGREIASAIMAVVTEDDAKDDAKGHDACWEFNKMDGTMFKGAVFEHLGLDPSKSFYGKSKKDAEGGVITHQEFYYTLDETKNKVEVYYGGTGIDYQVYPQTGKKLLK